MLKKMKKVVPRDAILNNTTLQALQYFLSISKETCKYFKDTFLKKKMYHHNPPKNKMSKKTKKKLLPKKKSGRGFISKKVPPQSIKIIYFITIRKIYQKLIQSTIMVIVF